MIEHRNRLEAALQSFANLDINHLRAEPDDRIIWVLNDTELTVGDIREAKRVLDMTVVEFDPARVTKGEKLPPLGEFSGYKKLEK